MQTEYVRLTDAQWEFIKEYLDWQRKRKLDLRDVFDGILYVTRTGIQWRNLKQTIYPDWQAVYYYFDKWKKEGTLALLNTHLNELERIQMGRQPSPSLCFADSQSIKLAPRIGRDRGLDPHKKVNGRKRHILVDVCGRIYQSHVHAANLYDGNEGQELLDISMEHFDRLEKIMTDKNYRGKFAKAVENLGLKFEVPKRPENLKGFVVEAKRWVVERTFAWLNFYRRVVIDYERTVESSNLFLTLANISMVIWKVKL